MFFGDDVTEDLKRLVVDEVAPGRDIDTDEKLNAWMRGMLVSALHPVGTCKMPECVDDFLRVNGVSSLRVCDASAFATQIDGNPAATLYAMGEKLADMLKFEYLKYINVVVRKELSRRIPEDITAYKANNESTASRLKSRCFTVTVSVEWISLGRDTSALIYKWSVICNYKVNEREIADELVKATPEAEGKDYCKSDGYPEFNRDVASLEDRQPEPKHKVSPYVFLVWCQGYPGVSSDDLWKKAGSWGRGNDRRPGSKNCFKLNCEEEMCSVLKYVNDIDRELIYKEPDLSLPFRDYVSTKKVASRDSDSSAYFRTSSMIAAPGTDWYEELANYLLETVYASSGHRLATQYPPLKNQPGWWTEISGGLLIYEGNPRVYSSESVAAFDLDGTIIKTKSGEIFPVDESDWVFTSDEVVKRLKKNHNMGINNVIMSNQAGISLGKQNKSQWMDKIEAITSKLNIPLYVLVATKYNKYRKPDNGMWEYYKCTLNQFKTIDMKTAVYVGGGPGSHSDSDKKFAEKVKIAFKTPEEYFGTKQKHSEL